MPTVLSLTQPHHAVLRYTGLITWQPHAVLYPLASCAAVSLLHRAPRLQPASPVASALAVRALHLALQHIKIASLLRMRAADRVYPLYHCGSRCGCLHDQPCEVKHRMPAVARCRTVYANPYNVLKFQKQHSVRTCIQRNARCRCRWGTACSPAPGCRSARGRPSWRLERTEDPFWYDCCVQSCTRITVCCLKAASDLRQLGSASTACDVPKHKQQGSAGGWGRRLVLWSTVARACAVAVAAVAGAAALAAVARRRPWFLRRGAGHEDVATQLRTATAGAVQNSAYVCPVKRIFGTAYAASPPWGLLKMPQQARLAVLHDSNTTATACNARPCRHST